jgi:hypothetical protein
MTNNSNGNSVNSGHGLINMEYPSSNSGVCANSNGSNSNGNNMNGFNSSNITGGSHSIPSKVAVGFPDQRNRNGSLGKSPKSTQPDDSSDDKLIAAKLIKALEQIQEANGVNLISIIEEIVSTKK